VITASSGEARVRAPSGAELDLATDTHVGLDELKGPSASLRLFAGKVRCRVPHLRSNEAFSVVTSDVRVVVHGTIFSVETSPEGTISVRVEEGVVVVQHPAGEVRLTASQSWNNRPTEPPPPAPQPIAKEGQEPPARPSLSAPPRKSGDAPPRGTLDEETRLLRSGLAAERRGDLTRAAASFDQLLARFPQSPLAPDARAALARVRSHQRAVP
jgi:hypothetical protein